MSVAIRKGRSSATLPDEPIRPRRWTREEYYRAADLGLFGPEERLELLDGEIYAKMSPRKPPRIRSLPAVTKARVPGSPVRVLYIACS